MTVLITTTTARLMRSSWVGGELGCKTIGCDKKFKPEDNLVSELTPDLVIGECRF
jgi:hypothetical protein